MDRKEFFFVKNLTHNFSATFPNDKKKNNMPLSIQLGSQSIEAKDGVVKLNGVQVATYSPTDADTSVINNHIVVNGESIYTLPFASSSSSSSRLSNSLIGTSIGNGATLRLGGNTMQDNHLRDQSRITQTIVPNNSLRGSTIRGGSIRIQQGDTVIPSPSSHSVRSIPYKRKERKTKPSKIPKESKQEAINTLLLEGQPSAASLSTVLCPECKTYAKTVFCEPCYHLVLCVDCARKKEHMTQCPYPECHAPIVGVRQVVY